MDHIATTVTAPAPLLPTGASLRFRALLQRANLQVASVALAHAPSTDHAAACIDRARQHLTQFECTTELYWDQVGGDITDDIAATLASMPMPGSWLEANIAQLVLSLATQHESRQFFDPSKPSRALLRHLAESAEHVEGAREALRDLCVAEPELSAQMPVLAARWLSFALDGLERGAQDTCLQRIRAAMPDGLMGVAYDYVAG